MIALSVLALFFFKWRKLNGELKQSRPKSEDKVHPTESAAAPMYELPQIGNVRYEAHGIPRAELSGSLVR